METIFDIATHQELEAILGEDLPLQDDSQPFALERRIAQNDPDTNAAYLAELFAMRGETSRAETYLATIKDAQFRLDTMLILQDLASLEESPIL